MAIPPLRPYVALGAVAWACGVVAYTVTLALMWHEGPSADKVLGLALSSLPEFIVAYAFVYMPVMLWLRQRFSSAYHVWLLPIASVPLAVIAAALVWLRVGLPIALLGLDFSTALAPRFFISPEAVLYYWFYGVAGVVIAVGINLLHRRETAI